MNNTNSRLLIEAKHMVMMQYAKGRIDNIPKKERVLTDMMRERMYRAWDLIGFQQWTRDRLPVLRELDIQINSLLRLVRLANDMGYLRGQPDENGNTRAYEIWAGMLSEEGRIIGKMITTCAKGHS